MNDGRFADMLLHWWQDNKRDLPWKSTTDPYKIWLSEIILQQTRVAQGTSYYLHFISTYPDIFALAAASEDQIMKSWEGLGYYSRARNLHYTSKHIVQHHKGIFPNQYEDILRLKGIGPYTAAAISSYAYDLPNAVVDGNVIRIISRILGISEPVDMAQTIKTIQSYVSKAVLGVVSSNFNQALMDFGSLVCTPQNPSCMKCPFGAYCKAYSQDQQHLLPFKSKKTMRKERFFHYLDITIKKDKTENIIIHHRGANDIWKKLYELPLVETESLQILKTPDVNTALVAIFGQSKWEIVTFTKVKEDIQLLTHRKIIGNFYKIIIDIGDFEINQPHYLVERKKVSNFAFPKIIAEYLKT